MTSVIASEWGNIPARSHGFALGSHRWRLPSIGLTLSLVLIALLGSSCEHNPVDPLPANVIEFTPTPFYSQWWAQVEQCSGLTGDFLAIHWYIVPNAFSFQLKDGRTASGAYFQSSNSIVIAEDVDGVALVVRHEELHALLKAEGHPPEYFVDKCGPLVTERD